MASRSFESLIRLLAAGLSAIGMLAACASGSCSDTRLLQPVASPTAMFSVDVNSEADTLLIRGDAVSLWLKPCIAGDRFGIPGSLCGTIILAPGAQLRFTGSEARVVDLVDHSERMQAYARTNFDQAGIHAGSSFQPSASWLASRPYTLSGSRLEFALFEQSYTGDSLEVIFPAMEVNSVPVSFPPVRLTPAVAKRCYHGAW